MASDNVWINIGADRGDGGQIIKTESARDYQSNAYNDFIQLDNSNYTQQKEYNPSNGVTFTLKYNYRMLESDFDKNVVLVDLIRDDGSVSVMSSNNKYLMGIAGVANRIMDIGGGRRKSFRRKSVRRKSVRRKSNRRKSVRRKTY